MGRLQEFLVVFLRAGTSLRDLRDPGPRSGGRAIRLSEWKDRALRDQHEEIRADHGA